MKLKGYSNREMSMLALAREVALKSECRQRLGAVAVKGGSLLGRATNRDYNEPSILEEEKVRYHASICAERRLLSMLSDEAAKGSIIYVVRAGRNVDNAYASSKPCDRCQKEMERRGVKRCVYID